MDLRQLRYFIAVARERNFTRASEELHIAQPALSRQIQQLEESLGVPLLVRTSRPLRLTEAGRVFYEQAIQVLGRVEQMKGAARRVGLNQRNTLSIGFVPSTLYGGLPMLVRMLRQRDPELDIQLQEMTTMQQIDSLKAGRIDIGFGRIRSNDPSIARIVLREERLVLAVSPGSSLAGDGVRISLAAIEGQRLLVYPKAPRPSFADYVLTLLHDQSIRPAEVQEISEMQSALGLVAAEVGVCVIPASARIRSDLNYRLIDDARATSPIILSHRVNDQSWYIEEVKTLIARMYAENPPWLDIEHNAFPDPGLRGEQ